MTLVVGPRKLTWHLVQSFGNGSLDKPIGVFATRELAVKSIPKKLGLYVMWAEDGEKFVDGTWVEYGVGE
jgi:hypothetical protein